MFEGNEAAKTQLQACLSLKFVSHSASFNVGCGHAIKNACFLFDIPCSIECCA